MRCGELQRILLAVLSVMISGCALTDTRAAGPPAAATAAEQSDWWKKNRSRAVFEPGKGYSVAGIEGYFDENGRPMDGGVERASFDRVDEKRNSNAALLDGIAPRKTLDRVKATLGQGADEAEARRLYDEGEVFFRKKEYKAAAAKYAAARKKAPETPLEEDALFMTAESNFFADRYPKANENYGLLVKNYPNTRHLDKVVARQFAIAQYWQQWAQKNHRWPLTPNLLDKTRHLFDTRGHAIRAYDNIRLNDPTGPLADDALMATAGAYFAVERYEDADYFYGLLRKEHPDSEHLYNAHLLGLQCKLRKYQGPDYDGTPLVEAKQLAESLLQQFPTELGQERERIVQTRQEIAAMQALRDWRLAEYYTGRQEYGSARYYYQHIVDEYPATQLAVQARQQLDAIGGEPDKPPQSMEWLTQFFVDPEDLPVIASDPTDDSLRR